MDNEKQEAILMQLMEAVAKLTSRFDAMERSMEQSLSNINERLTALEKIGRNDLQQDMRLDSMQQSLKLGVDHFSQIDKRLTALENAEADKVKKTWGSIKSYLLVALLAGVLTKLPELIDLFLKRG